MKNIVLFILGVVTLFSCEVSENNSEKKKVPAIKASQTDNDFNEYWYAGKAEISSYELDQARYGEMREGNAVLIFVTEPFSKKKQVKLDNPAEAGDDKQTVMKLNFTKKFETGIYPYSMMLSVFTPVDRYHYPNTVKTTMSSQEWCGQVFTQVNLGVDKYDIESFSYFESEGDENFSVNKTLIEDEIWSLIRIDFESLPTGNIELLPGIFATRLKHDELKPQKAEAQLTEDKANYTYTLNYENGRMLSIDFQKSFPYKILSWEETYSGVGGKKLTTKGKLNETLYIDYWNKNSNKDSVLRDSLKLP